ncbi:MAG TPA: tyrosine-type recombinase/integrase [Spirochaetia bacterium]|nr:tyrosine-type recombinase/integrase [Spirochaetia bacterium]
METVTKKRGLNRRQDELLAELEGIRDRYRLDVKQFIRFVISRRLFIVDGLEQYAKWLDEGGNGKKYSPATINRKIAAAKNRIRYAFRHSEYAADLRKRYQLEEVLKSVRLKKIDSLAVPPDKLLNVDEARLLVERAKDSSVKLMAMFLVGTGVRVSEMLGIRLSDIKNGKGAFAEVRVIGKGSRERMIHVKKELIERIRKHFHGTTLLFEHQGRPFSRISVTNRIKHEALRIIGREVTAQQLRHTWAAIQIQRGKDIRIVAAVLGHADPGVTARMYTRAKLAPGEAFLDLDEKKPAKPAKKTTALTRSGKRGFAAKSFS